MLHNFHLNWHKINENKLFSKTTLLLSFQIDVYGYVVNLVISWNYLLKRWQLYDRILHRDSNRFSFPGKFPNNIH